MTTAPAESQTAREWNMGRLIYNRRWVRRSEPYRHVVAQDVFVPEFYRELEADYRHLREQVKGSFTRSIKDYDAAASTLGEDHDGALGVFISREWHDMIAAVMGVEATGDVHASFHHHETGSASGWPHNDLSPGWFEDPPPGPAEVRLSDPDKLVYGKGPHSAETQAHEVMRGVSILFYLDNGPWQPGDGGETALFASSSDARAVGPAIAVPPIDNSIVIFECTPFSWHTFLSNRARPRNSLVMWLHRSKAEVTRRWGEASIVYWP